MFFTPEHPNPELLSSLVSKQLIISLCNSSHMAAAISRSIKCWSQRLGNFSYPFPASAIPEIRLSYNRYNTVLVAVTVLYFKACNRYDIDRADDSLIKR